MSRTRLDLLVLVLGAVCLGGCRGAERQPPIVFVSIDTLRADHLPDWGYAAGRTPHISELARTAIRFENAYSQVPLTFPSHSSLLTGLLPPDDGVRSNIGYRFEAGAQASIPSTLAAAGYATGGFVSSYVLRRETGLAAAFETYDDAMEVHEQATLGSLQRPGTVTVAAALRWLETLPPERPYFLFVHLFEPHFPYEPPAPFRDLPNPYDGEIAAADAALGPLFDALAARGDLDRALVALFSDHGEGLGEHGEKEHGILLYRTTLHVPLLLKLPGGRRRGEVVRAPAALVDLFPTVAEVAGVEPPPALAGRSLLTLSEGDAGRRIYSETLYPRLHLGWSQLRSLVDGRWHAIEGPDPELYDVVADPRELSNLRETARREYAERAAELAAMPLEFEPPAPASAEEMAKLAALGYLGGTSGASADDGPLPDPKAHMEILDAVQRSFTLTSEGRYEEALDLCYRLLAENPNLIDARNQLAGVLRKLGRFEEALEVYVETERRFPQFGESLAIERAKVELDLGRLDRAEAEARRALVANPLEAHLVLSAVAGRRSDWPGAIEEARAAVGDPDQPRVPALLLLAQALLAQDRLDAALAEAERAAEVTRRPGAAPVPTVDSTYGDILARLGRDAEAEAALRREIAHFPKAPEPYTRLAILLASQHRFDEIEPTLEALVAANPTPVAFVAAAETMERLGNVEDAARYRARARAADQEMARTAASRR